MNASLHDNNRFAVIKIVAIYAFVGMLWIYFSDTILGWMTHDLVFIKYIAISKGILFVIITAALLYILIHRHMNRLMKVNQMLQERELLLQSTATNIPGAMCQFYVSDAGDYGVSYVSDRVKDIFGLSTDLDTFFPAFTNHVMEEDRNRFLESIQESVSTDSPWKYEGRFIKPDGKMLWFQGMSTQQRVKERLLFYGVLLDITERKKAVEVLRESEKKYRDLFDFLPIPVYEMDFEANITSANRAIYETFKGTDEDLKKGFRVWQMFSPEEVHKSAENIQRLLKGEQIGGIEYTLMRLDGSVFPGIVTSSVIYNNGKPVGLRGAIVDITRHRQQEEELQRTLISLNNAFGATVQVMVSAIESRDPYTSGHQLRAAELACAIATEMGLPQHKIEGLQMAGSIHDIGKLSIPSEILSKPTKLSELEYSLIKEHAKTGFEMLKDVESPWPLAQIVYQHHERMDGSGYPRNLEGDEILLEARIIGVADVVEAMASHRPYRPGLGIEAALEEIEKNKGISYDNDAADACLRLFREKGYQLKQDGKTNPVDKT